MHAARFAVYGIAFIHKNNHVLLIKRSDTNSFCPGHYSLVGGLLEKHETFRQAIARELNEEIGITVNPADLHFVHMFHRIGTENEIVVGVFECTTWQGEMFNKEPQKHSDLAWFDINHLPDIMVPAHRNALELIKQKKLYSEQP
jgi:8-oxo-dGTP diphosphatase